MSRRERELVIALAEGLLEDETEARALIASSPRLLKIYQEQSAALTALSALPPIAMTESEKVDLRRDLWTAYTSQPQPTPTRRRGQLAWGYAAVFMMATVGLFAVLNGLPTESESTAGLGLGDAESASTSTIAAQSDLRLFANVLELAKAENLEYDLRAEDAGRQLEIWNECVEKAGLTQFAVIGTVEEEGLRMAIANEIPTEEPPPSALEQHLVLVDLDTCRVVVRDD